MYGLWSASVEYKKHTQIVKSSYIYKYTVYKSQSACLEKNLCHKKCTKCRQNNAHMHFNQSRESIHGTYLFRKKLILKTNQLCGEI